MSSEATQTTDIKSISAHILSSHLTGIYITFIFSMKTIAYEECEMVGTIVELMMDQVEFANVILLNKGDLVNE